MQAREHDQMEAVIMSASALVMMVHGLHGSWLARAKSPELADLRGVASERLREACKAVDEAMEKVSLICMACDCVDPHGYTDKAFDAMDRALFED